MEVEPINHITRGDNDRHPEFTYNSIHVDEVEDDNFNVPSGADYHMVHDDVLLYQYGERTQVIVTNDGAYIKKGSSRTDGEKQTYFVLSKLDEHGFVGGFRRT